MSPEAEMVRAVGPLWSADRVRAALGATEAEIADRRAAGTLLGVPTSDGEWFYPLNQFETQGGFVRVRPGLIEFFRVLRREDPWSTAMVAAASADELGCSPVEWVQSGGEIDALLDFAYVVRSEWSS